MPKANPFYSSDQKATTVSTMESKPDDHPDQKALGDQISEKVDSAKNKKPSGKASPKKKSKEGRDSKDRKSNLNDPSRKDKNGQTEPKINQKQSRVDSDLKTKLLHIEVSSG